MEKLTLLYSRAEILERVSEIAKKINRDYRGKRLLIVGILRGTFIFLADLIRQLQVEAEVDFIGISTYELGSQSSQQITLTKDLQVPVSGKDVLIVEDILDTGVTVDFVLKFLQQRQPASLKVCVLIDKKERRVIDVPVEYVGFDLAQGFVVGYGIDFAERYRWLSEIYRLDFA